ncbi:hypothetical protein GQF42_12260 [Streptomyces broussonetiae]|uniref:Uncharacterized protein n=1 Tax=Streptomyces broussonetiae TaxID=2686304 RepID=A0A6I6N0J6_9ACTN|nr:hypothetical protein [Streptomyces broussonetiae]QHA03951.1 hypothetical protein GQF42_12260 [Streptomyces broussonetiae]
MAQAAAVAKPPAPPRRRRASATPPGLPYPLIAPVLSPWAVSGVLASVAWVLLYNSRTGTTRYLTPPWASASTAPAVKVRIDRITALAEWGVMRVDSL